METPCKLQELLDSLDDALRDQTVDVLRDPLFSTASIVRILGKRGVKLDRHKVNECRKECDCTHRVRKGTSGR